MRDASLVRTLSRQTKRRVGLVPWPVVVRGAGAIRAEFARLSSEGVAHAIVDAIGDRDLIEIGAACADLALVTGGSGVALGLPQNFRAAGLLPERSDAAAVPAVSGGAAVLAGSCSAATRAQVAAWSVSRPAVALDPFAGDAGAIAAQALAAAAADIAAGQPVLVYSTAAPDAVADVQSRLGRERAAGLIEQAFAIVARELVARGVRRLVVAGGETAGAVVQALGVEALAIGREIDPGVPWTTAFGARPLALALKSGNFGAAEFFAKALAMLPD
jgi:uncharacterized protein YgbK (DUF1537 family)